MSEHITGKWSGPTGNRKPQPVADREATVHAAREALDRMEAMLDYFGERDCADLADVVREAL